MDVIEIIDGGQSIQYSSTLDVAVIVYVDIFVSQYIGNYCQRRRRRR